MVRIVLRHKVGWGGARYGDLARWRTGEETAPSAVRGFNAWLGLI